MCPACLAEYRDPANRRFHAQPNACPDCGPQVRLVYAGGGAVEDSGARDAIEATARALLDGAIVAVKGIGGFHLACRADDEAAVAELRARKHREDKPFALMAPDLGTVRELVDLKPPELELLLERARPIVLARRRPDAPVAESVAPGAAELGVMLPYSPLHHLLLADAATTLVMTSGNVSDEPIAFHDEEACERLAGHRGPLPHARPADRDAHRRLGRAPRGGEARRSCGARAGTCPSALPLPVDCGRHLLACGAELKNTFAVSKGGHAWVGHHVGDLKNYETLRSFVAGIDHFQRLFAVEPEVVALRPPPGVPVHEARAGAGRRCAWSACSITTRTWRLAWRSTESCAPRSARSSTAPATARTARSGEGSCCSGTSRASSAPGSLFPVRMPGGEAAIRQPWRMACAWLAAAFDEPRRPPKRLARQVEARSWEQVSQLAHQRRRLAAHHERRPALRRRRGALRAPVGGQLRGPGGG